MMNIVKMTLVLVIICMATSGLLAFVNAKTEGPIKKQKELALKRALKKVLPLFDNNPGAEKVALKIGQDKKGRDLFTDFYLGKKGGKINGVAFQWDTREGYSGLIRFIIGLEPDQGKIYGLKVMEHKETPGLGARMGEKEFLEQFSPQKGLTLENTVWKVKKDGGKFDQITGATITPRALLKAMGEGLAFFKEHKSEIIGQLK